MGTLMLAWDRLDPETPCTSPDGHEMLDVKQYGNDVPVRIVCSRCGAPGRVVTFA